jgi:DDE_Tnp_1-associated
MEGFDPVCRIAGSAVTRQFQTPRLVRNPNDSAVRGVVRRPERGDMAVFAEAKQDFLTKSLELKNGVPSHDTVSRVFRQIDPDQFRACFQKFVARFGETSTGAIAIDGKTLRRPSDPSRRAPSALHMISAWCCDKRLGT